MHVAIIGGASTIGSTVAYTVAGLAPSIDVSLVDIDEEAAWAHATDISHAGYHFANAPDGRSRVGPDGFGEVRSATPEDLPDLDPDLLVFNAAAPQPEDATDRGAREAELERNLAIVDDVAADLRGLDPTPLLVVTNPIDRLTYRFRSLLGWPREKFMGYSLSETARAADAIAEGLGVHRNAVHCPMMGEHGENVVPVFSRVRVDGEPVEVPESDRADVREYVRDVPFEIAKRRGVRETSRWVTSAGVTRVIRSMAAGGNEEPFCLSTPLAGEYGFEDVALGVPVTLDGDGVAEIHEWELSAEEGSQLTEAYEAVRADLERIE
ncbi:lactate dehydrogenase [Halorarum halophilum]|uniref:malate dehydrogenase n=1 Tax=Halorarum halophilum TaxID=2743090 RepID=A0A7D5GJC8_9EURY|nr:lactate dehydrogenase [Halobaculum halophilum]QLG28791.1 lactate dehydrogenase [Halobaculum halophilum]